MLAQGRCNTHCLARIVLFRAGRECHDEVDLFRFDAGIRHRPLHRQLYRPGLMPGVQPVVGIRTAAKARHFRIDLCAAFCGMLQFFQDQQTAALGDHRAGASGIERLACLLGRIVRIRRQALEQTLPHQSHRAELALGPAADTHVGRVANIVRCASPIARCPLASPQVIVLDGAWASCTIVT